MTAYYNDNDPYCAEWLRNLIAAGHLPPGDVDERDIRDVDPQDLEGHDQAHLFAGLGGWPHAARLAGVPDDFPLWTGSCPCQPLSSAGQRKGHADERHLWPAFHALIAERRPAMVFGEQVASKDGREWLAGVRTDLEDLGYACGAADLCAAGVGAPHIRQRLWWVAKPTGIRCEKCEHAREMARATGTQPKHERQQIPNGSVSDGPDGGWSSFDLIPCADGKTRRIEPGIKPLAHGIPKRMAKLRAIGNAIVPQAAAEFMRAAIDATPIDATPNMG